MIIEIPKDDLTVAYSRSGGPGGQHVNKVATKADVRFVLAEATWIPAPARHRMASLFANRITKDGEFVVTSQRTRSQADNLKDCFDKLAAMLATAAAKPKKRKPTRPSRRARQRRMDGKKSVSNKKKSRSWRPDSN